MLTKIPGCVVVRFAIPSNQFDAFKLHELVGECESFGGYRIVSESDLISIARMCGFGISQKAPQPSLYGDMTPLTLIEPTTPYFDGTKQIAIDNSIPGLRGHIFEGLVRRILGPIFIADRGDRSKKSIRIVIHSPGTARPSRTKRASVFHIYPFTVPRRWYALRQPIKKRMPNIINGECVGVGFEYEWSGIGIPVTDRIEQYGNSFCLRYSFDDLGAADQAWYRIHEHQLIRLRNTLIHRVADDEEVRHLWGHDRDRYIAVCAAARDHRERTPRRSPDQIQHQARELQRQLTVLLQELRRVDYREVDEQQYGNDFDILRNIEGVKNIVIDPDGKIMVETDMIYCRHPLTNRVHELGEFLITLNVSTREMTPSFGVTVTNLTRVPDGYHAPHVAKNGYPCWGSSLGAALPELVARQHYAVVFEMTLKFLSTVNMKDSWGDNINLFPVARSRL